MMECHKGFERCSNGSWIGVNFLKVYLWVESFVGLIQIVACVAWVHSLFGTIRCRTNSAPLQLPVGFFKVVPDGFMPILHIHDFHKIFQ